MIFLRRAKKYMPNSSETRISDIGCGMHKKRRHGHTSIFYYFRNIMVTIHYTAIYTCLSFSQQTKHKPFMVINVDDFDNGFIKIDRFVKKIEIIYNDYCYEFKLCPSSSLRICYTLSKVYNQKISCLELSGRYKYEVTYIDDMIDMEEID